MSESVPQPSTNSVAVHPATELAGWRMEEHRVVGSTQTLARGRRPWNAVVAEEQIRGRGQRERSFTSDRGGIFLSAVLPYAGDPVKTRGFALAIGWAVRESLLALGLHGLRLRWPNDLMIGRRKVGGILVEQGGPDTLVVGIGLNVTNQPWLAAPELREIACSLTEHWSGEMPTRAVLTATLLDGVRAAYGEFGRVGFAGLVERFNEACELPREVELEMANGESAFRGGFIGIEPSGDLRIVGASGSLRHVPEHHIARLRER